MVQIEQTFSILIFCPFFCLHALILGSSIYGLTRASLIRSTDSRLLFLPNSWSSWTFSFIQTPTLLKLSKSPSNVLKRGCIHVETSSKSTLHRDNSICFRKLENAKHLPCLYLFQNKYNYIIYISVARGDISTRECCPKNITLQFLKFYSIFLSFFLNSSINAEFFHYFSNLTLDFL